MEYLPGIFPIFTKESGNFLKVFDATDSFMVLICVNGCFMLLKRENSHVVVLERFDSCCCGCVLGL